MVGAIVPIAVLAVWMYAAALVLAPLAVFLRDITTIVPLLLRLGFFASPVMYSIETIPPQYAWLGDYNPVAVCITGVRDAMLAHSWPDWSALGDHRASSGLVAAGPRPRLLRPGAGPAGGRAVTAEADAPSPEAVGGDDDSVEGLIPEVGPVQEVDLPSVEVPRIEPPPVARAAVDHRRRRRQVVRRAPTAATSASPCPSPSPPSRPPGAVMALDPRRPRGRRGPVGRDHRQQRRGQEHDPQAHRRASPRRRGARSG